MEQAPLRLVPLVALSFLINSITVFHAGYGCILHTGGRHPSYPAHLLHSASKVALFFLSFISVNQEHKTDFENRPWFAGFGPRNKHARRDSYPYPNKQLTAFPQNHSVFFSLLILLLHPMQPRGFALAFVFPCLYEIDSESRIAKLGLFTTIYGMEKCKWDLGIFLLPL